MIPKKFFIPLIFTVFLGVLIISGCATSAGTSVDTIVRIEKDRIDRKKQDDGQTTIEVEDEGSGESVLKIYTAPDGAEVYVDGLYRGETPLTVTNAGTGTRTLEIIKKGFYPHEVDIEIPEGSTVIYQKELMRITGFLTVHVNPDGFLLEIDTLELNIEGDTAFFKLPIGTYNVLIRKFGFKPVEREIEIFDKKMSEISIFLEDAPFEIQSADLSRDRVNPENPGRLGDLTGSFEVTAPGSGEVVIKNSAGETVKRFLYNDFTSWNQYFIWELKDEALPDGKYSVSLTGSSPGGEEKDEASLDFVIDRSRVIRYHSLWNNTAGLLYASVPRPLPVYAAQVSVTGAAFVANRDDGLLTRVPLKAGLRFGLGAGTELNLHAGVLLFSDSDLSTYTAGFSLKKSLFRTPGGMISGAVTGGGSFFSNSRSDTYTDYPGIKLGVPLSLDIGPLSFLVGPEFVFSLSKPYDSDFLQETRLYPWMYLRSGLLLDFGVVNLGLSAAFRSLPFGEGFGLSPPVPLGGELHWMIPGTTAYLSIIGIAEFFSLSDWYFMGGVGFGMMN
ncbi:MAG: PEGA domain-containing protein [Spirochaetia bacterium]